MISSRQCSQASRRAVLSSRSRSCAAGSRARAPRRLRPPPCRRRAGAGRSAVRAEDGVDSQARGSADPARSVARRPGRQRRPCAAYRRISGRLLTDSEARVRRRAALAVGRVGLRDGVPLLTPLLNDADPEVRQMAAFALGLIGDRSARDPLVTALGDQSPLVQGSACEALGLIGDPAAAAPIGALLTRLVGRAGGNGRGRRRVEARHAGGGVPARPRSAGPSEGLRRAGGGRARRVGSAEGQVVAGGLRARPSRGQACAAGAPHPGRRQQSVHESVCRERTRRPSRSVGRSGSASAC